MLKKIFLPIFLFIICFFILDRCIGSVINIGLNRYFGLKQYSDVLLIGHSHLMLAIDKENFEQGIHKPVSKYCREGVDVYDKFQMVKQYLQQPESDSLKYVLYGVDQFMFNSSGLSKNSYKLFYPFIDQLDINQYIKESANNFDYIEHKLLCCTRYSDALLNSSLRGWLNNWKNYKIGNLNIDKLQKQIASGKERHIYFEEDLIKTFEQTLDILKERNIKIILINTPIVKILNEYEPEKYHKIIEYFKALDSSSDLIYYWDLNPEFSDKYELFYDAIHINSVGQKTTSQYITNKFNIEFGNLAY